MVRKFSVACVLFLSLNLSACSALFEGLSFETDGRVTRVNGVLTENALDEMSAHLAAHPGVQVLEFGDMPGSVDDDTNLQLARMLRARNMTIRLGPDAQIASGATDLFLSGTRREIACGAEFGVHSWYDSEGYGPRDLPRDPNNPDHKLYLDYYREMGIPEAFYWFTVDQADHDDMYYMSPDELARFGIPTVPMRCG